MKFKLIVMDMDGTLTNSEKRISPITRNTLIKAQQQGAKLVLASGRPTHGLYQEAKELRMDEFGGYLLSFNGAHVCDYPNHEVLYNQCIPTDYHRPIINNAKALNLNVMIHHGGDVMIDEEGTYKADYEAKICNMRVKVVDDLRTGIDFEVNKFLISAPEAYLKQQFEDFKLPFEDRLSIYTSAPFYIEVAPNGVDKGASLARLANTLHIKCEDIIAFGDEMNDLTMLQYAGYGVAMGNAVKPIKLIAKEVTKSNDEDGIACVLQKFM